jgi:hypothetical protein
MVASGRKHHILLVESDSDVLEATNKMLNARGHVAHSETASLGASGHPPRMLTNLALLYLSL